MGTATMRFAEGVIITGSAGTDTHSLVVTGSTTVLGDITCNNISIGADAVGTGRTISSGNTDTSIRFNANDGIDLVVGGTFMISCDENASQDTVVINEGSNDVDFRIESDNNTHHLYSDAGNDFMLINSDTATPGGMGSDTSVFVSGSKDGQGQAVFGGNVVISGSLVASGLSFPSSDGSANQVIKTDGSGNLSFVNQSGGGGDGAVSAVANGANNRVATFSASDELNGEANLNFDGSVLAVTGALGVYANISDYAAIIDNDQGSSGHGLKVTSDGTGAGTYLFDVESASTTVLRVRGDGRVGIGKVSSLPASVLTVSSSNSDSDLAIAHKIHHIGDSDTYIQFDDDEIQIAAGGRTFIKIEEASTDKIMINHGALDIDFQVKGENDANLMRTDAANDSIYFGASESVGADNNFFVSGSIDSRGTATRGTAVFGGDLVISGATRFHDHVIMGGTSASRLYFDSFGVANGPYIGGNTVALTIDGDNRILNYFDDDVLFIDEQDNSVLALIDENEGTGTHKNADANVIFSGSIGSKGTTTRGTAVFGGDVMVSGSIYSNTIPKVLMVHLTSTFTYNSSDSNELQTVPFNNVLQNTFGAGTFNTGTYTFTAPEEGFYYINLSVFQQSMNAPTQYQLFLSSSCDYANNHGAIAFVSYHPAGSSELSDKIHRLDRVAHLSGSQEVKVTFRNIGAAESGTTLNSGTHLTYLTINKL